MNSLIPSTQDYNVLQSLAQVANQSGLYKGVGGEANILMVLLAANDLGIKPTIALNGGIWNIKGKIELSARLMTSMIRKAGHSIKIVQLDSKVCILEGTRSDSKDSMQALFTIQDAAKAQLLHNPAWQKYTEDMLYARALSRLARRLYPDVIGSAYVEGEIRDCDLPDVTAETEIKKMRQIKKEKEVEVTPRSEDKENIYSPYISEEQIQELEEIYKECSEKTKLNLENFFKKYKHRFEKLEKASFKRWRDRLIQDRDENKNSSLNTQEEN